ncbi:translocation/assembly module TamB domain-containing protein [Labrys sp. LIt4]|uniref:translocation/assembly module TamB domain-containing protein n=1 Tax=Labrys sp. LIt4 TaxID=2821355 RepID=UPI001ADEC4B5|nr:translocation/assembly module TamB domain-containing protein [Labrys sp. LIt4]MBP0578453.1 translocation/assembly module TamB domain-containing protein [Labrys sp. LIt4]
MRRRIILFTAVAIVAVPLGLRALAPARADDASDKSWFITYVEDTISTPDQKISLGQIDGALSSDVRISSITIADRQGVWLTIKDAHLVWSRLALMSKKLDVDLLEAGSIEITRKPNPPQGVQPAASDGGFSLPELPVSVKLGKLAVPVVKLSAALAGEDTVFDVGGNALLADGKLHSELLIKRTQPAGGDLTFTADFDNATKQLGLNLSLQEPHGGFLSSMLKVPGQPPLGFTVVGSGPLDNFAADIALSADGNKLFGGKATLAQGANGVTFKADLGGNLERLVDPAYADFVRGQSALSIEGGQAAGGGYELEHATVKSGVLDLALSGALSPDAFPTRLKLDGKFGAEDGHDILLPGGNARIKGMTLAAQFGDGGWTANFDLQKLAAGTVAAESATIKAGGDAQNLADPQKRSLTFKVDGRGDKLSSSDAGLAKALGSSLGLTAAGKWQAGQPVVVDGVRLAANAFQAGFTGVVGSKMSGIYSLATPDISVFSGLAGRELRGKADLTAKGDVALAGGGLALTFEGKASDIVLGDPRLDAVLKGATDLRGGVRRDTAGLHFDKVTLGNPQFNASADGLYGAKAIDFKAAASLSDIKLVTDRASGAVEVTASLKGSAEKPDVVADLTAPRLMLQGKPFTDGKANFTGSVAGPAVNGVFSLAGLLDRMPVKAGATIATLPDGTHQINGLHVGAGAAQLAGDLAVAPSGRASGRLNAAIPDMAAIAPLLLVKASGSLTADIGLSVDGTKQNAAIKAQAKALKVEANSIGSATIDLTGRDLTGVPALEGTLNAANVQAGSFILSQLQATAKSEGENATAFQLQGTMPKGKLALAGAVKPAGDGLDARLDKLDVSQQGISASLQSPVTIASRKSGVTIPKAVLRIGQGGVVSVDGKVGETLAMNIVVGQLPLSLANIASPGLGATGTLSANVKLSGKPADPAAEFDVKGSGLSVAAAKGFGIPALQLAANGRYAGKAVTIGNASLTGAGGLSVTARGHVPLQGSGLSVDVQASAPLALANGALRDRGGRATGTLTLNAKAGGSISAPAVSGQAVIAGGTVTDPETGMKLTGIGSTIRFDRDRATIAQFTATTQGGGTIGVTGSVGLKPDFAADLKITARNAKLTDGNLATAIVSSDITVRGPLMARPVIGGRIDIQRAEITIPERFAANAAMLGVRHLKPPREVTQTLAKAKETAAAGKPRKGKAASGPNVVLDLTIDAPARIFVRGRGIDAELGGQMALKGSVAAISPVGFLEMRRGSLDVIGQHIVFDSGKVTLVGDLDPNIDFVASTRSSAITVTVRVTGRASDPQIVLSSVPQLPQDEVMARFLFGRSIQDLSPLQLAQLATAVAQLAGGPSGPGLLDSIRKSTGLDNLGVVTDSSGNAAVQAGTYIGDKIYLGVTSGVGGQTDATINLDVTRNLKLRGQAGTEGSKGGIYYEREY